MYVVFENDDGHWYSRFLHHNIKHCYVVVPSLDCCIVHSRTTAKFDLFNESDINVIIDPKSIIMGYKQKPNSRSLFMLNTCVGHTKQLLGINKPFIWTPYQLYKYLRKHNEKSKST